MPRGIRECDDTMGIVAQPIMKAGSVLFFVRANGPQWFAGWAEQHAVRRWTAVARTVR